MAGPERVNQAGDGVGLGGSISEAETRARESLAERAEVASTRVVMGRWVLVQYRVRVVAVVVLDRVARPTRTIGAEPSKWRRT